MKIAEVLNTFCLFVLYSLASEVDEDVKYMNKCVVKTSNGEEQANITVRNLGFDWEGPVHTLRRAERDDEQPAAVDEQAAAAAAAEGKDKSKRTDKPLEQGDVASVGKFSTKPPDKLMTWPYDWKMHRPFGLLSRKVSAYKAKFTDPEWNNQWYLQDYRTEEGPVMDHNVVPALAVATGKGVTIAIVDDGVRPHDDFAPNFDSTLCFDVTSGKSECTPYGQETMGTRTAGVIAMQPNEKCGVGVAHGAKLAAIKMFGPGSSDATDAQAQTMFLDKVDIYSNSWSYSDDGTDLVYLTDMMNDAFIEGATKGRGGKGAIYLLSAGSGKAAKDNCAANGLVNHPNTIVIGSADQLGKFTEYSEACAAVMAAAYSGGGPSTERVVSTDANGACTKEFTGTGPSVAIAAGIIALALEANPNLSYRDVMHLITMSAEVAPVSNGLYRWKQNKLGFWTSYHFGFGLLNAENMVNLAKGWTSVPELNICFVEHYPEMPEHVKYLGDNAELRFKTDACSGKAGEEVNFIEQVVVTVAVYYPYRGALKIKMHAPSGSKTELMDLRPKDKKKNLHFWPITSVHQWGEDPKGWWGVEVESHLRFTGAKAGMKRFYEGYIKPLIKLNSVGDSIDQGWFSYVSLTLYGTATAPAHHSQLPRKYAGVEMPTTAAKPMPKLIMD